MDRDAAAVGAELASWWHYYNRLYLGDVLRQPVFRIGDSDGSLGTWDRATRRLTISRRHLESDDWLRVMQTLRHEMAHQYVDEYLHAAEPPHGPAFRQACEKLRVSRLADGAITAADGAVLHRVGKLLSLSSSPNEHEAQVALSKARELLLRHNIDLAMVGERRSFGVRWFGKVRGRHHHHEHLLATVLTDFFFVSVIWTHSFDVTSGKRGTVLAAFGSEANLAMAEYVHDYLTGVAEACWREYRGREGLPGNRERLRYLAGLISGFHEKLQRRDRELRQRHALVWRGDPRLEEFVRYHHPNTRVGYTGGAERSAAYEAGVVEGRAVTLRRPLTTSRRFGGYLSDRGARHG